MKTFENFSEFDNYFVQLFKENNNAFSKVIYRDAPIGMALQHNLYDYFRQFIFAPESSGSFLQKMAFKVRAYGFDHRLKFFLNRLIGSGNQAASADKIVFFADNFVPRILDDFLKVMSKMDAGSIAFCTTDYRAYKYMREKKAGDYSVKLLNGKPNNFLCRG
ncbi:MAG: hypothetical protein EOO01_45170 [Chitinophagaceae bacterium]|nr:MAG: hypothetical protein EOO01_45170 [Chitinophagaceae bacterium]